MTSRQPLNARQLETLKWISDGCPEGYWQDFRYKTTCYALAERGLAIVDRRPKTWSAELTNAGAYYLEHGRYPGSTLAELQARAAAPRAGGHLAVSTAEYAAAIMQELEASDGETFEFAHASAYFNTNEIEKAAARSPWRPSGKKLKLRSTGTWEDRRYVAQLEHDPADDVERTEVHVPARITKLHLVAAAYRDDPDRHEVTKPHLARACRIVHAIAVEAERRVHSLSFTASPGRNYNAFRSSLSAGQFVMEVKGHRFALRLTELSAGGGGPTNYLQARSKARWHEPRNTTFVSTGKLSIAIVHWGSRSGRKEKFADGKRATLERQLGDLFWELEVRALEQDKVVKERERAEEARRNEHERALAAAKIKLIEADRVTQLHARAAEWDEYQRLRNYASAVAVRLAREGDPERGALDWLSWVQSHLATVDPLQDSPAMPAPPEPTKENMSQHLRGWSSVIPEPPQFCYSALARGALTQLLPLSQLAGPLQTAFDSQRQKGSGTQTAWQLPPTPGKVSAMPGRQRIIPADGADLLTILADLSRELEDLRTGLVSGATDAAVVADRALSGVQRLIDVLVPLVKDYTQRRN